MTLAETVDALILGIASDTLPPELRQRLGDEAAVWLTECLDREILAAAHRSRAYATLPTPAGPLPTLLVRVDVKGRERGEAFELASLALREFVGTSHRKLVLDWGGTIADEHFDAVVAGGYAGVDGQGLYRSEDDSKLPSNVHLIGGNQAAIDRGTIVGQCINHTRRLVNAPASEINPVTFAQQAEETARQSGLEIEVWDERRLEQEGCRAILAVGRASATPPRLVILRHSGGPAGQAPIAIVGKGVTFDSGGLSLKPSDAMMDMKCDMAGAATVVGVMRAVAELKLPRNVVGLCGLAENMIAGDAYRLGDVIETRSGKTIEIHNTDAEGRVVLADTLDVALQQQPQSIIDLATLTGACLVALGVETVGMMGNDQTWIDQILSAAKQEGEWAWQLPMFELFDEKIKSKVADIKNVGNGRWGGAITAAKFLEAFVGDVPWCHLDIAGPAFADSALPHRDAGATGVMVRTLIRLLQEQ
ncbi:MAG: leucyl aminopeptidase [Planctomycetota bacterium]